MSDVEALLRAQESALARDAEISRILACCPSDYFALLEINPLHDLDSIASRIKKVYRKKSLLIHPDKVKHADAPKAFDLLKKAELRLSDPDETAEKDALLEVYKEVAQGLNAQIVDKYDAPDNVSIREKVALVLQGHAKLQEIEQQYNQRQEVQRQEEVKNAAKDRELKRSWESRWERDRDDRVKLWRSFTSKVEKKKKKKKVLV